MINIDNKALLHNANYFSNLLGQSKLCAVLKCDAYGHGLATCATVLSDSVDMIALCTVSEANSVRHVGLPILMLLPLDVTDTTQAVSNGYLLTVDSLDTARIVARHGTDAVVHIKVDSGMCRLGATHDNLLTIVDILTDAGVIISGVYSHCSMASDTESTHKQFMYFNHCCHMLACRLGYMPTRHFANTQAVLSDKMYHIDMARVGLGLYGYGSRELLPVKKVYGKVLSVKFVGAGSTVGYDNTYVVPKDTNVAVVDVGYWQGVWQGIDSVVINNKVCNVVGKVCMGMFMVDIGTNIVKQFDLVTIIGDNIDMYNSDKSIYELLCNTKDTERY